MANKQKHLPKEQQLLIAIEQLALGREYVIARQRFNVTELVNFHDSLQNGKKRDVDGGPDWGLERKYSNYRKVFNDFGLPVILDFQKKIIQGYDERPDSIRRLMSGYLRAFAWNYSEEALDLFIRNTPLGADALFLLVTIRYSIIHGLSMDFVYRKLLSMRDTQRRAVPLCILVNRGQFFVVALESGSDFPKQFLLSRVIRLRSDLVERFHDSGRAPAVPVFRPEAYLSSESAGFSRPKVKYVFKMYGNTLDHFRHFFNVEHRVIEGKPKKCTVEVETHDQEIAFQIAFRYGEWCELVGPDTAVKRMIDRINRVLERHSAATAKKEKAQWR